MAWRTARSLDTLLAQLNKMAPKRSKVSDGSIGDAAHASRDSDHNPWIKSGGVGVVTARDFSNDPAGGLDCNWLAARLVASGDPRIKYIIWNRRIWTAKSGWVAYKGINPHDKHLHLSVSEQPGWFDSTMPWAAVSDSAAGSPITILPVNPPVLEDDMFDDTDRRELGEVKRLLGNLNGYLNSANQNENEARLLPKTAGEVQRMFGVILGWQPPASENERQALAKLWNTTPANVTVTLDPAQIAAAIPADLAGRVADELSKRLAA